jgi:hypothetical protein
MNLPSYSKPASELIAERYSCRVFAASDASTFSAFASLKSFADSIGPAPLGGRPRFELIASESGDDQALKGLGTYGFIKDPSAYLAVVQTPGCEIADLGWGTELVVLKATELGMGSCWLGGTFRRGRFAKAARLARGERLAIVIALGKPAPGSADDAKRRRIGGNTRKPWAELFFDGTLESPIAAPGDLSPLGIPGEWSPVLEAFRLSPSASNKQPWALARSGGAWTLYFKRSPGYYPRWAERLGIADMQLNDLGIAMSHLALVAAERGIPGAWKPEPGLRKPAARAKGAVEAKPLLAATFR